MFCSTLLLVLAADPYLAEGQRHFDALEFAAATTSLTVAVEQPELSVEQRRQAFHLLAQSLLALDRRDDARLAYERLLKRDPLAPPPEAAPKVVDAFLAAKASVWPRPSVTLKAREDLPSVTVEVFDPWALVARVRCFERVDGRLVEAATAAQQPLWRVQPRDAAERVLIDALDRSGVLLAHLEVPLALRPPASTTVSGAPPRSRLAAVLLTSAAVVAVGFGASLLGVGYRQAPTLTAADDINRWNASTSAEVATGWALSGGAVLLGVAAAIAWSF